MQSLFFRTFVASWLATLLVSVGFAFIYVSQDTDHYWRDWHGLHADAFPPRVQHALADVEGSGPHVLEALVKTLERGALDLRVYAVTSSEFPQSNLPIGAQSIGELAVARGAVEQRLSEERAYFAVPVAERFPGTALVGELRRPSMLFWYIDPQTLPLRLLVLLTVSALFCYCISKPLSRRLKAIRDGSQQLAAGNLAVRLGPQLEEPDDEATGLARDFDHMAERVRELIVSQQRLQLDLLRDLRSPLDRLMAALELARGDTGEKCPLYQQRVTLEATRLRELLDHALSHAPGDAEPAPHAAASSAAAGG
jgi:methyl-accepting chemotaxis protein